MATAADLIKASLRKINVTASGETPSSAELADGLVVLNNILEDWSNDGFMIFEVTEEELALTAGVSQYTIGVGATWNTVRPQIITGAWAKYAGQTIKHPIDVVERDDWNGISNTDLSSIPRMLFYNQKYPYAEVNLWPKPSASDAIVIQSLKPLAALTQATVLSYPPGYRRALEYNLAFEYGIEFGKPVSQEVRELASASKTGIQRQNTSTPVMTSDLVGVIGCGGHSFEAGS